MKSSGSEGWTVEVLTLACSLHMHTWSHCALLYWALQTVHLFFLFLQVESLGRPCVYCCQFLIANIYSVSVCHILIILPIFQNFTLLFVISDLRSYCCHCFCFLNWGMHIFWASLVAQTAKNLPAMLETWVWSLSREDPLEKGISAHSSVLAWRIPWTEEPGGCSLKESQRVSMTERLSTVWHADVLDMILLRSY